MKNRLRAALLASTVLAWPAGAQVLSGGSIAVPNANLVGGNGVNLLPVIVGTGLSFNSGTQTLAATGTSLTVPNSLIIGGNGTTLTSVPSGTTGNSVALLTTSGGLISPAVLPTPSATTLGGVQSAAAVTHQWLASLSTGGVFALAQPAAADITGLAASATTDTTNASNISSGTLALARLPFTLPTANLLGGNGTAFTSITVGSGLSLTAGTLTATALTVPNSTVIGGNGTALTSVASGTTGNSVVLLTGSGGTIAASVLPNPSASTLGGVQSAAAVTHQFLTSISTSGVPALAQPAFSDISGTAAAAQLPLATTSAFGAVKPDGSTVTISAGVISAASSGVALSGLTAATGANTIASGDNAQAWQWALTTAAKSGFAIKESAAATNGSGSQFLLDVGTLANSTASPFRVSIQGTTVISTASAGGVTINGGSGIGTGSALTLQGGVSGATGGAALIAGGDGSTNGGNLVVRGGNGTGGTGGSVTIQSGASSVFGTGVAISTPNANGSGGISLTTGNSTANLSVGNITFTAGSNTAGSAFNVAGGSIGFTSGAGGITNSNGGDITFTLGAKAGTGRQGLIIITTFPTADPHVVGALWNNSGVLTVSAG